jgi:hypothetical protein
VKLLSVASKRKHPQDRVVIIVDGLQHLDADDDAHLMKWLPGILPPQVKVILTTSTTHPTWSNLKRSHTVEEMTLAPIPIEDAKRLVRTFLDRFHKKLSEDPNNTLLGDQMAALVAKQEASLPLYLLAAGHDLISFGVYEQVTAYIKSMPERLPELFDFILGRLEADHGRELVSVVLGYIAVSTTGILEKDLVQMVEAHPYTEPRESNFARLFGSIALYVTTGGAGMLRIVYQPIREVVEKRYLNAGAQRKQFHQSLQSYYLSLADPQGDGSFAGEQAAPLVALPLHTLQAEGTDGVAKLLMRPGFLRAKLLFAGVGATLRDFRLVPRDQHPLVHILRRLMTGSSSFTTAEPDALPAQLMARLYRLRDTDETARALCEECQRTCSEFLPVGTIAASAVITSMDQTDILNEETEGAEDKNGAGSQGVQPPPAVGELFRFGRRHAPQTTLRRHAPQTTLRRPLVISSPFIVCRATRCSGFHLAALGCSCGAALTASVRV